MKREKILDIRNVGKESVRLAWLAPIVEQFDELIMSPEQRDELGFRDLTSLRGILVSIKENESNTQTS